MSRRGSHEHQQEMYWQTVGTRNESDSWLNTYHPEATPEQRQTFMEKYRVNESGRTGQSRLEHAWLETLVP